MSEPSIRSDNSRGKRVNAIQRARTCRHALRGLSNLPYHSCDFKKIRDVGSGRVEVLQFIRKAGKLAQEFFVNTTNDITLRLRFMNMAFEPLLAQISAQSQCIGR